MEWFQDRDLGDESDVSQTEAVGWQSGPLPDWALRWRQDLVNKFDLENYYFMGNLKMVEHLKYYLVHSLEDFKKTCDEAPFEPGSPHLWWPVKVDPRVPAGKIWFPRVEGWDELSLEGAVGAYSALDPTTW